MTNLEAGRLSAQDAARIGHLEASIETLDKRLDRILGELHNLRVDTEKAATTRDVIVQARKVRGSLAFWCIALAVVVWYFADGAAWLAPLIRQWTG
jgi:hypothetical protein